MAIGFPESALRTRFDSVQPMTTISPRYAMPEESGLTIFVCRRPKESMEKMWPGLRYLD